MRVNRGTVATAGVVLPSSSTRWFCLYLWKLPILTSCTLFFGSCIAGILSIVLRPARPYVLPLFSDISAHNPERYILQLSFGVASPLLLATIIACLLHAREIRRARHPSANPTSSPSADSTPSTPRGTPKLNLRHTRPIDIGPNAASRRRISRVSSRSAILLLIVFSLGALTLALQLGVLRVSGAVDGFRKPTLRIAIPWLHCQLLYNALIAYWILASVVLTWYFFLLQSIPVLTRSSGVNEDPMRELLEAVWLPSWARDWGRWLQGNLRVLCITGQAVCAIKILGLWFALKNFSISRRKLIKLGLLATLAFAEYSATVFFSCLLVVLALDIRARVGCSDRQCVSLPGASQNVVSALLSPSSVGP